MSTNEHAPPAAADSGHVHESKRPLYLRTFFSLFVMTVAEVALTFVLKDAALVVMLTAACIAKAVLVAGVFMHLKFEVKTLVMIVCAPIVFTAILFIGLMPDSDRWFNDRMPGFASFRG
jgi:cytochrome c oxidase subunit IV